MKNFDYSGRLTHKSGAKSKFRLGESVKIDDWSSKHKVQDIKNGSIFPLYRIYSDSPVWFDEFELNSCEEEVFMDEIKKGMIFSSGNQVFEIVDFSDNGYYIRVDSGKITEGDIKSQKLPEVRFDSVGRAYISSASKFKIGDTVRARWLDSIPKHYHKIVSITYEDGEFTYKLDDNSTFSEDVLVL